MDGASSFGERARNLVADFRQVGIEASRQLESDQKSQDRLVFEWVKKEAEISLNILDSMASNTYKLSQDLEAVPQGMGYFKKGILSGVAPVYDLGLAKLEGRLAALKEKMLNRNRMAGTPPVVTDFFPVGETFDWYNPADWARQAEYDAALALYNVGQGIGGATNSVLATGAKVVVGGLLIKLVYDHFKQPTKKKG